jgi:hypothetical protein
MADTTPEDVQVWNDLFILEQIRVRAIEALAFAIGFIQGNLGEDQVPPLITTALKELSDKAIWPTLPKPK